ncbi:hypothetical protein [Glutamicibacter arilaitensis]|uniref:hypothetical protein n=1 Tax=Glutamicibacter arilaitensis TaxID=256701 RepID=UPI003F8F056F
MTKVHVLNTDNLKTGNSVEVHAPGCAHVARYKSNPWYEEGWIDEVADAQAIFNEYNSDFYAESGDEGCWPITVFPCSGLVKRKTDITEWKD